MAGDDITNSELARRLDALAHDLREDLQDIKQRQDQYVLREVYSAHRTADHARLGAVEKWKDTTDDQRRSDRRWLISAILVPLFVVVVQVFLALKGPS